MYDGAPGKEREDEEGAVESLNPRPLLSCVYWVHGQVVSRAQMTRLGGCVSLSHCSSSPSPSSSSKWHRRTTDAHPTHATHATHPRLTCILDHRPALLTVHAQENTRKNAQRTRSLSPRRTATRTTFYPTAISPLVRAQERALLPAQNGTMLPFPPSDSPAPRRSRLPHRHHAIPVQAGPLPSTFPSSSLHPSLELRGWTLWSME